MILISNLTELKLLNLEVIKNDKNIMEEYIMLDLFYEKQAFERILKCLFYYGIDVDITHK